MTTRFSNLDKTIDDNDNINGVSDAVERSRRIIVAARADAEKLLLDAQRIIAAENQRAFDEGYEEGKKQFTAKLLEIEKIKRETLKEQQEKLVEIALTVAEEVIGDSIQEKPESILKRVTRALTQVSQASQISLVVSPDDLEFLRARISELSAVLQVPIEILLREEVGMVRGNARIETDVSIIESSVTSHLRAIKNHLLRVVPSMEEAASEK